MNEDEIMTAIDESTPRMKERKRGWRKKVAWWNDELAGMRREVVAAKKQLARRRKWSCLVEAEKRYLAEQDIFSFLEHFFHGDEEDACDGSHQHIRELVKSYQNCNVEGPVTRKEISRCLRRSKAPGPDGVLYEHLKVVQEICPDSLAGLLNKYLYNRIYPVNWKVAKLAVIPKGKGASLTKAGSYGPISLLSAMGKLYERISVSRVEQDYDLTVRLNLVSMRLFLLKTPYARRLKPSKIQIKSFYNYYLLIFKAPLITYGGLQFYYV